MAVQRIEDLIPSIFYVPQNAATHREPQRRAREARDIQTENPLRESLPQRVTTLKKTAKTNPLSESHRSLSDKVQRLAQRFYHFMTKTPAKKPKVIKDIIKLRDARDSASDPKKKVEFEKLLSQKITRAFRLTITAKYKGDNRIQIELAKLMGFSVEKVQDHINTAIEADKKRLLTS